MRFLVPITGKLLVDADTEALAKERANVYMADHGLSFIKAASYGVEQIASEAVVLHTPSEGTIVVDFKREGDHAVG